MVVGCRVKSRKKTQFCGDRLCAGSVRRAYLRAALAPLKLAAQDKRPSANGGPAIAARRFTTVKFTPIRYSLINIQGILMWLYYSI